MRMAEWAESAPYLADIRSFRGCDTVEDGPVKSRSLTLTAAGPAAGPALGHSVIVNLSITQIVVELRSIFTLIYGVIGCFLTYVT